MLKPILQRLASASAFCILFMASKTTQLRRPYALSLLPGRVAVTAAARFEASVDNLVVVSTGCGGAGQLQARWGRF